MNQENLNSLAGFLVELNQVDQLAQLTIKLGQAAYFLATDHHSQEASAVSSILCIIRQAIDQDELVKKDKTA